MKINFIAIMFILIQSIHSQKNNNSIESSIKTRFIILNTIEPNISSTNSAHSDIHTFNTHTNSKLRVLLSPLKIGKETKKKVLLIHDTPKISITGGVSIF